MNGKIKRNIPKQTKYLKSLQFRVDTVPEMARFGIIIIALTVFNKSRREKNNSFFIFE